MTVAVSCNECSMFTLIFSLSEGLQNLSESLRESQSFFSLDFQNEILYETCSLISEFSETCFLSVILPYSLPDCKSKNLKAGNLKYPHPMKARLTLKPGQKGTGKPAHLYGDRLFRVRYRYDEKTGKRFKTVELIVGETDRKPPEKGISGDRIAGIQVGYEEKDLQNRVRKSGGVWDRDQKLRHLRHEKVLELGLTDRIMQTDIPEIS